MLFPKQPKQLVKSNNELIYFELDFVCFKRFHLVQNNQYFRLF